MIGQRTGEACAVAGSKVLILESLSMAQVLWGQYVLAERALRMLRHNDVSLKVLWHAA